jgi:hypothetical protein
MSIHCAVMTDAQLEEWAAEVSALPPRKRKNWKPRAGARGADGSLAVVRVAAGEGVHFERRLSAREAALRGMPAGSWLPIISVTERGLMLEELREHVGAERVAVVQPGGGPADLRPGDDAFLEDAVAEWLAARTGNHRPHRHRVRIPTAAGEPVRG